MGTLNIPSSNLIVTEGEPCNVTCYAVGWTPLPNISWELEVPVSHSSYYSFLEPGNSLRVLSVLDLTPLGNGTLTCVAEMKDLQASESLTVNLTVVQPPPGKWASPSSKPWSDNSEFMGGSALGQHELSAWKITLPLGGDSYDRLDNLTCSYNCFFRVFLFPNCKLTIEKPHALLR